MTQKKYFCYEIFKNLSLWSNNGRLGYNPCSFYDGFYYQDDQIELERAWNSPGRQQIIDLVNADQPVPGCHRCYTQEQQGLVSRRQQSQLLYEQWHGDTTIELSGPQGLDYSVGNLCNLKCVICSPWSSSQWYEDYQKLYPEQNIKHLKYQKHNQLKINNNSSLENVVSLHFHGGGEPLLSNSHLELLQRIDQVKGLADVRVFYNTNGTVTVSDEVLKIWERCKLVELYFSIDDIKQRFEYQRTGAKFDTLVKTLDWYKTSMPHNHLFKINTVWSYLNFYYLDELMNWHHENFRVNRYGDPTPVIFQAAIGVTQLQHVSNKTKEKLLTKFSQWPELCSLVNALTVNNQTHDKFLNWIKNLDSIRNLNFNEIVPEWAEILNENSV